MTMLQEQAVAMIGSMNDESIIYVIQYMQDLKTETAAKEASGRTELQRTKEDNAFQNLEKYFGRIKEPIDIKADLEKRLGEKYAGVD